MASSFAIYPRLQPKSVVITGGASGIGAEIVRAFADQKSDVGFVDFDVERGGSLADELNRDGASVRFEACDLRDIQALQRAFTALAEVHGPALVLVNNAARDDRLSARASSYGRRRIFPDGGQFSRCDENERSFFSCLK